MSNWIQYWSHIPTSNRTIIIACGLLFFWILEGPFPLFRTQYRKWSHAGVNLFFTLTTLLVNFAFAWATVTSSDWASQRHFGLLYLFPLPTWAFLLLGLMMLDLVSAWLIHWIMHRTRWMWQFHTIHHIDRHVDVTTANRHHPVESVFRAVFTWLAVMISGAPVWVLMLYQALSVLFSQFNHANIRLPEKLDSLISWVIVSPNMHKVHHHLERPYTDSNYGNIFSCWDRLFGTFQHLRPSDLKYGLDTHIREGDSETIRMLLQAPFQPYRPRPDHDERPGTAPAQ